MSKEAMLSQIEIKLELYKGTLKEKLEILKNDVDTTLKQLDNMPNFTPNSLGIIQMMGQQIDVLCGGLRAIIKENKKHGYELFITYRTNPTLEEFIKEVGNINKDKHYFKAPTGILVLRTKGNIFIKEN